MIRLRPLLATLLLGAALLAISLYPFEGWRTVAEPPWAFLLKPLPRYRTAADMVSNFLAYIPFGVAMLMLMQKSWPSVTLFRPLLWVVLAAGLLALSVEALQTGLPSRRAEWTDAALNTGGALFGGVIGWVWLLIRRRGHADREPASLGLGVLTALWLLGLAAKSDHWLARGSLLVPSLDWRPFAGFGPVAERLMMDASLTAVALLGLTLVLAQRLRLRQASGLHRAVPLGWVYLACAAVSLVVKQALLVGFGHISDITDLNWLTPGGLAGVLIGGLLTAAVACLGSGLRLVLALVLLALQGLLSQGLQASLATLRASHLPLLGGPAGPWANLEGLTQLSAELWPAIAGLGLLIWRLTFRRKLTG